MGLISRVSSRTYRFIIMTLGEDEAHALLIKNTTGVDLTQNEANDSPNHAAADSNELNLGNLLAGLAASAKNENLRAKVKKNKKASSKAFDAPAEGPAADRAERAAKYEQAKEVTLDKWEPIVHQHERKAQVVFPLNAHDSEALKTDATELRSKSFHFTPKKQLELEMAKLFNPSSKVLPPAAGGLSEFEKKLMEKLSVKEMKSRVAQLRANRFLSSSQEAKNKRQKKIKSKNFRRRQRKAEEKQEAKALDAAERLAKAGDTENLELLQANQDRQRALERASLRHKHTSDKVRAAKRFAKFNEQE